jgi:small conductance mechanosensitive channel
MHYSFLKRAVLCCILLWSVSWTAANADTSSSATKPVAVTTVDPNIPLDELELLLEPMAKDELFVEADGWLELLKSAVRDVNKKELQVKKKNIEIEAAKEKVEQAESSPGKAETREQAQVEAKSEDKSETLDEVAELRDIRTAQIDHLNVVLNEINDKIGMNPEGGEKEEVQPYRLYIDAVSGIKVDVTDTQAALVTIMNWLISEEGGIRWAKNFGIFLLTIIAFWMLAKILSRGVRKALTVTKNTSVLLSEFIINSVRRVVIIIGILIGLSNLEVNIGPLLAVIGAAGFVIAFALQDTLSNFASGIMIMFYRPFDVDDIIDVSGTTGKVKSMNLVTTTIMTFDNKLVIVPNNSIWGNIITNATASSERRVDMVFGIGYDDDVDLAKRLLEDIVTTHPLVLDDPEPVIKLHELADSSLNFICRPWVKTADYWSVYWDVTCSVKERFSEEGISIPFPQRDVHIYNQQVSPTSKSLPHDSNASVTSRQAVDQSGLDDENSGDNS